MLGSRSGVQFNLMQFFGVFVWHTHGMPEGRYPTVKAWLKCGLIARLNILTDNRQLVLRRSSDSIKTPGRFLIFTSASRQPVRPSTVTSPVPGASGVRGPGRLVESERYLTSPTTWHAGRGGPGAGVSAGADPPTCRNPVNLFEGRQRGTPASAAFSRAFAVISGGFTLPFVPRSKKALSLCAGCLT